MPKLFLICTGLGIVKRGFETYIADLGEKLIEHNSKFTTVVYSGGKHPISKQLFCISRNNSVWSKIIGSTATADLELISFFFSLLLQIVLQKPTAIYLGEYKLYCYLFKVRKLLGFNFSLVLYTGGQASPGLYDIKKDYVQHVTDVYYSDLLKKGYPANRQFIIPHFVNFNNQIDPKIEGSIRKMANGKKIIISVGVINQSIKRMELLVDILADNVSEYFPLILGEFTSETHRIQFKLDQKFGLSNYFIDLVPKASIHSYLNEADLFVLLSPKESFGIAAVEALFCGLPVILCDFEEARYVFKNQVNYVEIDSANLISAEIKNILLKENTSFNKENRKEFVIQNYSWLSLKANYYEMFNTILLN